MIAITPHEVIPNGFVGVVENPSLSGRGETAGVYDGEVQRQAFVFLDAAGQEPMLAGARHHGQRRRLHRAVGTQQRQHERRATPCRSVSRIGATEPSASCCGPTATTRAGAHCALVHGRFGVAVLPPSFGSEFEPNHVVRIDTDTGARRGHAAARIPVLTAGTPTSASTSQTTATWWSRSRPGRRAATVAQRSPRTSSRGTCRPTPRRSSADRRARRVAPGFPSISGDGRFVSFTSAKPLTGPQRTRGPWVYVADRANGQIRMISAPNAIVVPHVDHPRRSQVAYTVAAAACTSSTVSDA